MPQHHYRTYCYSNDTDDTPRFEFFKDEDNKQAIVKFFGLIPLPLALISLVLAVCYAICLCGAIKGKHGNAKYDALILNRTVGDILCCVSALVTSLYVINTMHINSFFFVVSETFFSGSYWSVIVTYVSLSVTKLYSVWKPFNYRLFCTMKRCLHIIAFSWIIFILAVACAVIVIAMIEVRWLNEWSSCKYETCFQLMQNIKFVIAILTFFFTIIIFIFTVALVKKSQKFISSFKLPNRNDSRSSVQYTLAKLSPNIATFAFFTFPYIIWSFALLFVGDRCYVFNNLAELLRFLGIIRLFLLLRILVDPIVSFIMERQIRMGGLYWYQRLLHPGVRHRSRRTIAPEAAIKSPR